MTSYELTALFKGLDVVDFIDNQERYMLRT